VSSRFSFATPGNGGPERSAIAGYPSGEKPERKDRFGRKSLDERESL